MTVNLIKQHSASLFNRQARLGNHVMPSHVDSPQLVFPWISRVSGGYTVSHGRTATSSWRSTRRGRSAWRGFSDDHYDDIVHFAAQHISVAVGAGRALLVRADGVVGARASYRIGVKIALGDYSAPLPPLRTAASMRRLCPFDIRTSTRWSRCQISASQRSNRVAPSTTQLDADCLAGTCRTMIALPRRRSL